MRANEFITEMETDSQRRIEFSKLNPPSEQHILKAFIQRMLQQDNKIPAQKLIDIWNNMYGLNLTLRSLSRTASANDLIKSQFIQAITRSP